MALNQRWPIEETSHCPKRLLLSGYGSDIEVIVDGETFHLHRPILSRQSVYFKDFFHLCSISKDSGFTSSAKVHEFPTESPLSADVFAAYVEWWYTDKAPLLECSSVEQRVNNELYAHSISAFLGTPCLQQKFGYEGPIFSGVNLTAKGLLFSEQETVIPMKFLVHGRDVRSQFVSGKDLETMTSLIRTKVGDWFDYQVVAFRLLRERPRFGRTPLLMEVQFLESESNVKEGEQRTRVSHDEFFSYNGTLPVAEGNIDGFLRNAILFAAQVTVNRYRVEEFRDGK